MKLPPVLQELLALPTAPFAEQAVLEFLVNDCRRLPAVTTHVDRWGNLVAHYRHRPTRAKPIVLAAHTDHPGFVALAMKDPRTLRAAFRGWVEPDYFVGTRVRFHGGGTWVRGVVQKITRTAKVYRHIGRTARPEEVEVRVAGPVDTGAPGMWDLPDPVLRDGLVRARGCDDVAGVAALLEMLRRLSAKRARADVRVLFTRAEEVGFVGAIAAARSGTIPRDLPIIAIETSKALPHARIGDGPILRVGDKASIFDPSLTAFCERVAIELAESNKRFKFQRRLMDGGTCESTAYAAYGYTATGICVALGNYHNMNVDRRRIDSEYVSLDDWCGMVDWFIALATDREGFKPGPSPLRRDLDRRFASWRKLLAAPTAR